ncbi:ribosomal protein S18 [Kwoniella heveanensis CBS 569]|nr:ribosomal protein S18 [Kwoniella heveanensis CBS 569]
MVRPTAISISSIRTRMLHTSLPHRAPASNPASSSSASTSTRDILSSLLSQTQAQAQAQSDSQLKALDMLASITSRDANAVDETRKTFRAGHFTPPHSLTSTSLYPEQKPFPRAPLLGPPKKVAAKIDPFHLSKTSPTSHDLNPLFALAFVNQMGKIKGRAETGLTWKSQRKVGKLVRRARAMGLISAWNNQPVPGGLAAGGMSRFSRF